MLQPHLGRVFIPLRAPLAWASRGLHDLHRGNTAHKSHDPMTPKFTVCRSSSFCLSSCIISIGSGPNTFRKPEQPSTTGILSSFRTCSAKICTVCGERLKDIELLNREHMHIVVTWGNEMAPQPQRGKKWKERVITFNPSHISDMTTKSFST